MELTPENIYTGISTIGLGLYTISQLLALFGKPGWAEQVRILSKSIDIFGANHGKSANLLDSQAKH